MTHYLFLLLFFFVSCSTQPNIVTIGSKLDTRQVEIIDHTQQVRAYRISPVQSKSILQVDDYAILRRTPVMTGDVSKSIAKVLTKIEIDPLIQSKELFVPCILFKVKDGKETVKFYIDLDSNKIQVKSPTSKGTYDICCNQTCLMKMLHNLFPFDDRFEQ